MKLDITVLKNVFSICRFDSTHSIPNWALDSEFYSISKTNEELSVVCSSKLVPQNVAAEIDYCCLKVLGPLDFSLTGITAKLSNPLSEAGIPIFVIATHDTDYVLFKQEHLPRVKKIYRKFCNFV